MVYQWLKNIRLSERQATPRACSLCRCEIDPNDQGSACALLLCRYCQGVLPRSSQACFTCGIAIPCSESGNALIQSCGACIGQMPVQYRSVCAYKYEFPFPELIQQLKYQRQLSQTPLLSALFADYCRTAYQDDCLPEFIIPVPLHPKREFSRGFNQAEILSKGIGKLLGVPLLNHTIQRIRHTPPQMGLSITEREHNLRGAFKLNHFPNAHHIALFDDVITTGATLSTLAKLLSKRGVQRIDFWSLARTPKP